MSFRKRSIAVNQNVYFNNRQSTFMNPPIRYGNLYVENNENIGNDLDVSGNIRIGHDLHAKNYYADHGNFYLDNYLLIPYGTIIQSAATSIPDGWLNCDGSSFSTLTYVNLFNVIGHTYGGDGFYFKVPNMQGRVAIGSGSGDGLSARYLAQIGGEETHTLSTNEMPSHTHTSNANGGSGVGALGLVQVTGNNTMNGDVNGGNEIDLYAPTQTLTINPNGGGVAHINMQPFIVLHYLIKY